MAVGFQCSKTQMSTTENRLNRRAKAIDKVMHFCQKESEETVKKVKESNRRCHFYSNLP